MWRFVGASALRRCHGERTDESPNRGIPTKVRSVNFDLQSAAPYHGTSVLGISSSSPCWEAIGLRMKGVVADVSSCVG